MLKRTLISAALLVAASQVSAQGTRSEGYFQIYNDTANNILIGFYTNNGSDWSDNWIDGYEVDQGASMQAEFFAPEGLCDQVFAAGWLADNGDEIIDEPIAIDICQASNVYLGDNEIFYD